MVAVVVLFIVAVGVGVGVGVGVKVKPVKFSESLAGMVEVNVGAVLVGVELSVWTSSLVMFGIAAV